MAHRAIFGRSLSTYPHSLRTSTSTGLYGPYDKGASDGRQLQVAGFLDTLFKVEYTRTGMKANANAASMRYSCHINNDELPVKLDKTTKTEGYVTNVPDSGEVYVFPTVNQATPAV